MLQNESQFNTTLDGKKITLHTIRNNNSLTAQITNYGAILVSLLVPDKNGNIADIVQGYDNIGDYLKGNDPYMGAICGRCANRIAKGKFRLNGNEYTLAVNNGPNHLHGGIKGFDKVVWDVQSSSVDSLTLQHYSKDGEEGYPGNLTVTVTYSLTDNDELVIDYSAKTDKKTIVNLASHSYFNLAGEGSGDVLSQELLINAKFFTPMDETSIPTGEIAGVEGTPMDFTSLHPIGKYIDAGNEQLRFGAGYDHNFVLDHPVGKSGLAAIAHDPASGRTMEVRTTQPGLQLYTANWVNGETGKGGKKYYQRWAFCLETQCFPDAVNKPHFPKVILNPGEEYRQGTIHRFYIK